MYGAGPAALFLIKIEPGRRLPPVVAGPSTQTRSWPRTEPDDLDADDWQPTQLALEPMTDPEDQALEAMPLTVS
jgi:hypothetical protein